MSMPAAIGVSELRWLLGPYTILFALTLLPLVRRLYQLSREIEAAREAPGPG